MVIGLNLKGLIGDTRCGVFGSWLESVNGSLLFRSNCFKSFSYYHSFLNYINKLIQFVRFFNHEVNSSFLHLRFLQVYTPVELRKSLYMLFLSFFVLSDISLKSRFNKIIVFCYCLSPRERSYFCFHPVIPPFIPKTGAISICFTTPVLCWIKPVPVDFPPTWIPTAEVTPSPRSILFKLFSVSP